MKLRHIIAVLAVLIILVGLMEIIFPYRSISLSEKLMHSVAIRLTGVLGLAIGVVFVTAAVKRQVGLKLFMLIIGAYMMVGSAVMFTSPSFIQDLTDAIFLKRPIGTQLTLLWATGLLRIAIGAAMLYAVAKAPQGVEPAP